MTEPRKRRGNGSPEREEDKAFSVVDRRAHAGGGSPATGDAPGAGGDAPRYPTVVEELRARAEEAERRAREISAAYRRVEEEREAFRERLSRDLERRVDIARVDMMRKILGVLDDLDRALAAAADADPRSLAAGVGLIRDHLLQVLASEGVTPIDLEGERFDPGIAEAVSVEETDDPGRDARVVAQSGRGYRVGTTLIRPARVRVARYRGKDSMETAPEDGTIEETVVESRRPGRDD